MKLLSVFALAASLILGSFTTQSIFFSTKAYAGKMNGKPGGGRNSAHYDNPSSKKKKKTY